MDFRICATTFSTMNLEYNCTSDSKINQESDFPKQIESLKDNHSKDCLKFCRKVSTRALEDLTIRTDLVKEVTKFNSELLKHFLNSLGFKEIDGFEVLENLQVECLLKLWSQFKDAMSYSKNKKICIVKFEHWGLIFDKKISIAQLKEIVAKKADSCEDPQLHPILKDETFSEILARMLFCSNNILTLTSILRDTSPKGEALRKMDTIGNFLLLALYPQYFSFYNHRSGKFALECCGKCKICHSKTIPSNFLKDLARARQEMEFSLSRINKLFNLYGTKNFASILMEFTYNQF